MSEPERTDKPFDEKLEIAPPRKLSLQARLEEHKLAGYGAMIGAVAGAMLGPLGAAIGGAIGGGVGSLLDRKFRHPKQPDDKA